MRFEDFQLDAALLKAVRGSGYDAPTPIQQQAIPHVLAGRDVLGSAQTGTGKTAAFALPILQRLGRQAPAPGRFRALVLCPTRELAQQIQESFITYGRHAGVRTVAIFGGVGQTPQARAVRDGVHVVIATPGRLLDLMQQGLVSLRGVEVAVLDEADRMLDMGFLPDIRRILSHTPRPRQSLLFSATMPEPIRVLAGEFLTDPVRVEVGRVSASAVTVEQSVHHVEPADKTALLLRLIGETPAERVLVFTRTKHGADRLTKHLAAAGVSALAIHGNKSQGARNRALAEFRTARTPVLVATDIAARGIDVDEIAQVINYDMAIDPETYVHRIGRTGRAGATGRAALFCSADERDDLRAIERLVGPALRHANAPTAAARPGQPAARRAEAPRDDRRREQRRDHHRPTDRPRRDDRPHRDDRPRRDERPADGRAHAPAPRRPEHDGRSDARRNAPPREAPARGGQAHPADNHPRALRQHDRQGRPRAEQRPGTRDNGGGRRSAPAGGLAPRPKRGKRRYQMSGR